LTLVTTRLSVLAVWSVSTPLLAVEPSSTTLNEIVRVVVTLSPGV